MRTSNMGLVSFQASADSRDVRKAELMFRMTPVTGITPRARSYRTSATNINVDSTLSLTALRSSTSILGKNKRP
jgi:hypothetical protein